MGQLWDDARQEESNLSQNYLIKSDRIAQTSREINSLKEGLVCQKYEIKGQNGTHDSC